MDGCARAYRRSVGDPGGERADLARRIARVHAGFLAGEPLSSPALRAEVAQSWQRAAGARVNPDSGPPVMLTDGDLDAYRAAHPLAAVIGMLRELVGAVAEDGQHLMAVGDAAGRLLWVEGDRVTRKRAEAMNFIEGAAWDEPHAGTNAPGTALAVGRPVQIFSTEHFLHAVQRWTCAAAPIRDPATGQVLGVVDVTGGDPVAHPHSLALVKAAARAAEGELGWRRPGGTGLLRPSPPLPDRLELLGRHDGLLRTGGLNVRLGRRQAEILFVLSAHPLGMSGEQLADALFSDGTGPAAVRVELTRLRRLVGDLVRSRPYRLARPLDSDYADVCAALRRGDVAGALAACPGPLLPHSEAPLVVTQRRWLEVRLRSAVLASGSPGLLADWAERFGFEDLQAWERLTAVLPTGSGQRASAAVRAGELRREYGLPTDVAFT